MTYFQRSFGIKAEPDFNIWEIHIFNCHSEPKLTWFQHLENMFFSTSWKIFIINVWKTHLFTFHSEPKFSIWKIYILNIDFILMLLTGTILVLPVHFLVSPSVAERQGPALTSAIALPGSADRPLKMEHGSGWAVICLKRTPHLNSVCLTAVGRSTFYIQNINMYWRFTLNIHKQGCTFAHRARGFECSIVAQWKAGISFRVLLRC